MGAYYSPYIFNKKRCIQSASMRPGTHSVFGFRTRRNDREPNGEVYEILVLLDVFGIVSYAPSTCIQIFLNPQLFLPGYGYCPHAYGEFASKSGNFSLRSPEWKFFNPIIFQIRVDGRIRIFSDTMSSQNWRQYLPRKFKHSRRSKANSSCAPWAYFQSFSLYVAKFCCTKC